MLYTVSQSPKYTMINLLWFLGAGISQILMLSEKMPHSFRSRVPFSASRFLSGVQVSRPGIHASRYLGARVPECQLPRWQGAQVPGAQVPTAKVPRWQGDSRLCPQGVSSASLSAPLYQKWVIPCCGNFSIFIIFTLLDDKFFSWLLFHCRKHPGRKGLQIHRALYFV